MPKKYKLKNRKSVLKRFKKRKSGSIEKRKEGQGHYNANDSTATKQRKKGSITLLKGDAKLISGQIRAL